MGWNHQPDKSFYFVSIFDFPTFQCTFSNPCQIYQSHYANLCHSHRLRCFATETGAFNTTAAGSWGIPDCYRIMLCIYIYTLYTCILLHCSCDNQFFHTIERNVWVQFVHSRASELWASFQSWSRRFLVPGFLSLCFLPGGNESIFQDWRWDVGRQFRWLKIEPVLIEKFRKPWACINTVLELQHRVGIE